MTAAMLLRALCAFLRSAVDEYAAAQDKKGDYRKPKVFEWYLPFRDGRNQPDIVFPYIVARIVSGEDPEEEPQPTLISTVRVDVSFGVYNEGVAGELVLPDGNYDLLNLMEHVRIKLFRQGVIDSRYRIEKPYKWLIPEDQPYPLWVGQAQTIWTVAAPLQQFVEEDLHGNRF